MPRLQPISDGVWGATTTIHIGLGAHLPLRMTVLREGGSLWLVSPIEIDDTLAEELAALGEVRALVAPNLLHHTHLGAAKARYPAARLLGAPGLAEKRSDLRFDGTLESGPVTAQIEARRIEGADKLSEVVLWHRPSRTLVVTDAVFHILEARGMSKFVLRYLSGAFGRLEQSRLLRSLTSDRQAAGRSVEALLEWPIARVVMAHGEVLEGDDAAERLRAALWWWRGAKRPAVETTQGSAARDATC